MFNGFVYHTNDGRLRNLISVYTFINISIMLILMNVMDIKIELTLKYIVLDVKDILI